MSKKQNSLFIVVVLSIIWIIGPIPYDEMRSRYPIYPQENGVVLNSSSILTQNDELGFLEGKGQVKLAKGVESFSVTPSYPGRRPQDGRVPGGTSKPPRAPNGFYRTPPKVVDNGVNNRLYGEPGGYGGAGGGDPGDDSNSGKPNSESEEQCQDPGVYGQMSKKPKKKKKSRQVSKERVTQAYENFMLKMSRKGYKVDVPLDRFLKLAINPQTGQFEEKSIFEAEGGLEGEAQGMYKNLRRPSNKDIDLDFEATRIDSEESLFVDHKGMIDFGSLEDEGIDISGFLSHADVAYNMGRDSVKQKERFVGFDQGPKSKQDVLHLYDFKKIRNPDQKPSLVQAVLNGAENAGYQEGIAFLNYE